MPPKKGKKGKAADDWEAELGETIAPANGDAAPAEDGAEAQEEQDEAPAGGLMAMMKKNREKRKKKGLSDDFEPEAAPEEPVEDLTTKAPQEATMDDEFALPGKKGKGGKGGKGGKQQPAAAAAAAADADEELGEGGRVLTKAEKEKLKKEREKQRKKEQVRRTTGCADEPPPC